MNKEELDSVKKAVIKDLGKSKGDDIGNKTVKDLADLIRDEDYETAINVITDTALDIKFTVGNKAKRRRSLTELRNHLANTQAHARANRLDAAYRQDFKQAFQLLYDNGR